MLMRVLELDELMDDRGTFQDLVGTKERVSDAVNYRDLIPAQAYLDKHDTNLRERGIREGTLYIALNLAQQDSVYARDQANTSHHH
jgi:hypothetical protein